MSDTPEKPKRLLPQFSLLTLVLFVAVCGSGYGLWTQWTPWATAHILREHSEAVYSAEFSSDGMRLLTIGETVSAVEKAMRSGFGADQSILVLFADPAMFEDIDAGRFFRVVQRDSTELKPFDTFLEANGPRCGQVRDSQRSFLFHDDSDEIGSLALIPLGKNAQIGFLAIGSADADRFHPGMSIDFLARIGDLVAGALARH